MYLSGAQLTLDDVALLAEGVDRNNEVHQYQNYDNMSPSSRRAWIEICRPPVRRCRCRRRPPRGGRG